MSYWGAFGSERGYIAYMVPRIGIASTAKALDITEHRLRKKMDAYGIVCDNPKPKLRVKQVTPKRGGSYSKNVACRKWTEKEVQILQAYYPTHGLSWDGWTELLPDRTRGGIQKKVKVLKLHRA